jgi:hypothetical protein
VPTEHPISASARTASAEDVARALSILSAPRVRLIDDN